MVAGKLQLFAELFVITAATSGVKSVVTPKPTKKLVESEYCLARFLILLLGITCW